MDIYK